VYVYFASSTEKFVTCPFCKREITTVATVDLDFLLIKCEKCGRVIEADLFYPELSKILSKR
jgi:transcription elongation factor Elf1